MKQRNKEHDKQTRNLRLYGPSCLVCHAPPRNVAGSELCMSCWLKQRDQWRRFLAGSRYENRQAGEPAGSVRPERPQQGLPEVPPAAQDRWEVDQASTQCQDV